MVRLLHPIFSTSTTLRSNWGSVVGAGVVLTNREKCSPSKLGAVRPHSKKENSINLRPAEDMNMRRLNERGWRRIAASYTGSATGRSSEKEEKKRKNMIGRC
ncbi:hypothetical protein V3C99_002388 [Haemonchus contortus]